MPERRIKEGNGAVMGRLKIYIHSGQGKSPLRNGHLSKDIKEARNHCPGKECPHRVAGGVL